MSAGAKIQTQIWHSYSPTSTSPCKMSNATLQGCCEESKGYHGEKDNTQHFVCLVTNNQKAWDGSISPSRHTWISYCCFLAPSLTPCPRKSFWPRFLKYLSALCSLFVLLFSFPGSFHLIPSLRSLFAVSACTWAFSWRSKILFHSKDQPQAKHGIG